MAHILIIEDDEAVQNLFGLFLESAGFTVACASDGSEGMRLMKQQKPDLIITDIMMPEMDGLEVIREVHASHPGLPVIAISGGMKIRPVNFLAHAEKFGARRVLQKPIELSALLQAVQELLAEAASNKQAASAGEEPEPSAPSRP